MFYEDGLRFAELFRKEKNCLIVIMFIFAVSFAGRVFVECVGVNRLNVVLLEGIITDFIPIVLIAILHNKRLRNSTIYSPIMPNYVYENRSNEKILIKKESSEKILSENGSMKEILIKKDSSKEILIENGSSKEILSENGSIKEILSEDEHEKQ